MSNDRDTGPVFVPGTHYEAAQAVTAYDPALPGNDHTVTQYITVAPAAKAIWKSKTFWLNTVLLVVGVVSVLAQSELFTEYAPQLTMIAALLNLVLRFLTSTALDTTGLTSRIDKSADTLQ